MNESKRSEETLFEALSQLSSLERATALEEACGQDPALRERLEILLAAHDRASGFMAEPVAPALPGNGGLRIPVAERLGDQIGPYKLLQQIGEGGCGVVYMAQQDAPVRRLVALKIIKLGMDTKQVVARFEAERQALALMEHSNIAKVLDAGATETGRPFFVMELVRGIKITDYCDQNQLPTAQRLDLFIQVCRAVQHAHQKGVIHRDIKPSNILVTVNDGVPVPKVIDFGIAKATQGRLTDQTLVTAFDQFIGTPAYVSPEQAVMTSLDIDTRSDIYSLGVLLYELLTGRTPFDTQRLLAAGLDELRRTIREQQPVRPSTRLSAMAEADLTTVANARRVEPARLTSLLRGDLDWIVMKCLEKDRARRYETANGLARDIERHLHNEPVSARPPSRLYEFRKTVRRHWVGFAAVAAVLAALAIGVVVSTVEAVRAQQAQREQSRLRDAEAERLYASRMNMVQAAWEQNRIPQMRKLLEQTAAWPGRGFEWYYWQRQAHLELVTLRGHLDEISSVAFSPDGRRIVTGGLDMVARVWDADTGAELLQLKGHLHAVMGVAYSADGRRIATGSADTTVRIWDASNGKPLLTLPGHNGRIQDVAFSPDGSRLVTASWDGTAKVWDAASGNPLLTLPGHTGQCHSARFSPEGQRIVTSGDDHMARIWDAVTGQELLPIRTHSGVVFFAAFSPDGQRIVTSGDAQDPVARVWEVATGHLILVLAGHNDEIGTVLFSSDGGRIVTASSDRTARVWDATTGKELFTIKGHVRGVNDVAFSPDGQRIVTGSADHTAKVWDATGDHEVLTLKGHADEVLDAAWSRDGRLVVTGSADQTAKVWDAAAGKKLLTLPTKTDAEHGHTRPIRCVAFSPDSRRIVTGSGDQKAKAWDAGTGAYLFTLSGHKGALIDVAYSLDGQWIATASSDRTARLWEAASGKPRATLTGHSAGIWDLDFSPDSRRLITGSEDHTARIWDVADGKELPPRLVITHTNAVTAVAFSPDGLRVVTGCSDGTIRIWDAANGHLLLTIEGHTDSIGTVAFSPDSLRVLSCSGDLTAKLWDATSGQELLTLKGPGGTTGLGRFTTNGSRILTASPVWTAQIWDAATADQLAAWQQEEKSAAERLAALERQQSAPAEHLRASSTNDPGAIKTWLILGPANFQGYNGAKALDVEQVVGEASLRPKAGQEILVAGSPLGWREVALNDYLIDFHDLTQANPKWSVAYAVCYLESDTDQTDLTMKVGSEDQSKVYLNGKEIYRYEKPRQYVPDQDVVTGVELHKGLNVLVFKILNEVDVWRASLRFTDAADQRLKGVRVTLEPDKREL